MVFLSPFYFIEDSESIIASLPLFLHVSSSLILPLFSELLKRKNWKFCLSLGFFLFHPPILVLVMKEVGVFYFCKAMHW